MKSPIDAFSPLAYPTGNITQFFGENQALYFKEFQMQGHNGWDIVAPWGTPLLAVMDGIIGEVKEESTGYGKQIRLIGDIGDTYLEWVYGHCSQIGVKRGQRVVAGQQIALMGNTGFVVSGATPFWKYNPYAGTHLHLGVRQVKKGSITTISWLNDQPENRITGELLNANNGFKGSIDPHPFFLNTIPYYEPNTFDLTKQSIINRLAVLYAQLKALTK